MSGHWQWVHALSGEHETTWTPWTDDFAVGFKVQRPGRPTRYVYLNPSLASDDGAAVVFFYAGDAGDPNHDEPVSHLTIFDGDFDGEAS
jgi:hypothetical protein